MKKPDTFKVHFPASSLIHDYQKQSANPFIFHFSRYDLDNSYFYLLLLVQRCITLHYNVEPKRARERNFYFLVQRRTRWINACRGFSIVASS